MTNPIAKLRSLHEAATTGEWFFDSYSRVLSRDDTLSDDPDECFTDVAYCPITSGDTGTKQGQNDLQAIAATHNALPALLDYVEALEVAMRDHDIGHPDCPDCEDNRETLDQDRAALEAALEE